MSAPLTPEERREAVAHAEAWLGGVTPFRESPEETTRIAQAVLSFDAALSAVEQERDEWKSEAERSKWPKDAAREYNRMRVDLPKAEREVERLKAQLAVLTGLIDDGATAPLANARSALRTGDYSGWIDVETAAWLCIVADALASVSGADATEEQVCRCGHIGYWHSHNGHGDCEFNGDCKCQRFSTEAASE